MTAVQSARQGVAHRARGQPPGAWLNVHTPTFIPHRHQTGPAILTEVCAIPDTTKVAHSLGSMVRRVGEMENTGC